MRRCAKVRYGTENEAIVKLASMWKRVRRGRRRFTERAAYFCARCDGWHLTSAAPS